MTQLEFKNTETEMGMIVDWILLGSNEFWQKKKKWHTTRHEAKCLTEKTSSLMTVKYMNIT
jgi:hypothetical protein